LGGHDKIQKRGKAWIHPLGKLIGLFLCAGRSYKLANIVPGYIQHPFQGFQALLVFKLLLNCLYFCSILLFYLKIVKCSSFLDDLKKIFVKVDKDNQL